MKNFTEKVHDIVKNIPSGKTLSYKQVADFAGSPGASRAVGSILKKNTNLNIPCHRVIKSSGEFGQYNGLRNTSKESLLKSEKNL